MPIHIVRAPVSLDELRRIAAPQFGDFVKAVVDVSRGVMAIGGELHADEEALLLQDGASSAGCHSPQATGRGTDQFPRRCPSGLAEVSIAAGSRSSSW